MRIHSRSLFTASRPLRLAAFALALTAACDQPTLTLDDAAYAPTGSVPFIYHWRAGHAIAIYVDRTEEPDDADLGQAVDDAIKAWTSVALLGEVRFKVVTDVHQADVIFHHYRAPRIVDSDACPPFGTGAGGQTFFCVPDDVNPVALDLADGQPSHVMMDVAVNRFALDSAEFFPALVAHEMGHVLGIGSHSPNASDLMYGRPRIFAPAPADIATMRYILTRRPDVWF